MLTHPNRHTHPPPSYHTTCFVSSRVRSFSLMFCCRDESTLLYCPFVPASRVNHKTAEPGADVYSNPETGASHLCMIKGYVSVRVVLVPLACARSLVLFCACTCVCLCLYLCLCLFLCLCWCVGARARATYRCISVCMGASVGACACAYDRTCACVVLGLACGACVYACSVHMLFCASMCVHVHTGSSIWCIPS